MHVHQVQEASERAPMGGEGGCGGRGASRAGGVGTCLSVGWGRGSSSWGTRHSAPRGGMGDRCGNPPELIRLKCDYAAPEGLESLRTSNGLTLKAVKQSVG